MTELATSMIDAETQCSAFTTCPGCCSSETRSFFLLETAAANVGQLPASVEAARCATQGSVELVICRNCGLIHNRRFDVSRVGFEPGYEVSLFHTSIFREFIQSLCERLIKNYDLHGKRILEIGCGGGDFLELICRSGGNQGVGIDPTIAEELSKTVGRGTVRYIPGFFQSEHAQFLGDFVCCLSVFEAIPTPLEFLQQLRELIGQRDIPVYFEVFNGFRSIERSEVWSIHYEQCNYFSLTSLTGVFRRAGFDVIDSGQCYQGDQYLYIEARPAKNSAVFDDQHDSLKVDQMILRTEQFENEYRDRQRQWEKRLSTWQEAGTSVVAWGSGGKGISLLNAFDRSDIIRCVVDVNPDRQQHFIPLTGHRIVDPGDLIDQPPDVVIVTNPLYRSEIEAQLIAMDLHPEILVA